MKRLRLLLVLSFFFAAACGEIPTEAPSPEALSPVAMKSVLSEVQSGESSQRASGHTNFTIEDGLQTMSFHAAKNGDEVSGSFQIKSRGQDTKVHGRLDCLTIVGNQAFLNGIVERVNEDSPFIAFLFPGSRVYFGVEDDGEGQGAVDRWTDLFPVGSFDDCPDLGFELLPSEGGNIQVKP